MSGKSECHSLADGVSTRKSEQIQATAREMPINPKKHLSSYCCIIQYKGATATTTEKATHRSLIFYDG
jgi:hypothetical protein